MNFFCAKIAAEINNSVNNLEDLFCGRITPELNNSIDFFCGTLAEIYNSKDLFCGRIAAEINNSVDIFCGTLAAELYNSVDLFYDHMTWSCCFKWLLITMADQDSLSLSYLDSMAISLKADSKTTISCLMYSSDVAHTSLRLPKISTTLRLQ